jgi:phosphatidylglycerol:prolipoprotein diacylglycerol transferase
MLFIPWFRLHHWIIEFGDGHLVAISPFYVFMGGATLVGLWIAVTYARRRGRSVARTVDFALHIFVFAFPVSMLVNGVFYRPEAVARVLEDPANAWNVSLGWSMYGGILGGVLGAFVWKWRRGGSILETSDAFAFAGPFAWCIGRIGCFLVHDHPGRVSDFALAVADYRTGAPPYLPRHDLGLYEAMWLAAVAVVFLSLSRVPRAPGFYMGLLALLYAPARFLLDFLRAPSSEGGDVRYLGLTPSQYVSVGVFLTGMAVLRRSRRT